MLRFLILAIVLVVASVVMLLAQIIAIIPAAVILGLLALYLRRGNRGVYVTGSPMES